MGLHPRDLNENQQLEFLSGTGKHLQHLVLQDVLNRLPEVNFSGYKAFGVVRNPIDRFVSEYNWRKAIGHPIVSDKSIDDFAKYLLKESKMGDFSDPHYKLQSEFFKIPAHFKDISLSIFRIENGLQDVEGFISKILPLEGKRLEHVNKTGKTADKGDMSCDSITIIKSIYAVDFEKFYPNEL